MVNFLFVLSLFTHFASLFASIEQPNTSIREGAQQLIMITVNDSGTVKMFQMESEDEFEEKGVKWRQMNCNLEMEPPDNETQRIIYTMMMPVVCLLGWD